jgi:D-aminopeptidase
VGLARAGSYMSNGSGDFVIAFSTRNLEDHSPSKSLRQAEELENDYVSPLFLAVVESVEEAIDNSLLKATTVTGYQGHTMEAIPIEKLREILAQRRTPSVAR